MMALNLPNKFHLYFALLVALKATRGLCNPVQISWTGKVTAGHRTTFICSSSCFPNCIYTWNFKDKTINGSTFSWTPDGRDDSVELQCTVLKPETGTSISTTAIINIKNPVSVQTRPLNTVPAVNQSLDMVCHHSAFNAQQSPSEIIWFKDGAKLTLNNNMKFIQNNSTLRFDPLLPSNGGFYHCEVYFPNLQTTVMSIGYLLSAEPWNVTISGPDSVFEGRRSRFTCLPSCNLNLECTVRWEFRGGFPIGSFFSVHANELRWTPSIPGTFQNFTCVAENAAAGRSAEATKTVEVKGTPVSGSEAMKLSGLMSLVLIVEVFALFDFVIY